MSLALQQPPPGVDRTVTEVLDAISRETAQMYNAAVRLQSMAGDLIDRASVQAHDPLMEEAQALDTLAQKLDALTGFLERLAQTASPAWRMDIADAVGPVFLADLAKRLCREHTPEEDCTGPTGDFEMF